MDKNEYDRKLDLIKDQIFELAKLDNPDLLIVDLEIYLKLILQNPNIGEVKL